jgi:hypothetical protein
MHLLAQTPGAPPAISASTVFYLSLLLIFLTAIITALVTKWSKDKCLKLFNGYHVTLERARGQTTWGILKVFSTGIEILYDHALTDARGRKKTSYILYQQELDQQVLSLLRYHDELPPARQAARLLEVHRTFNPGPFRRLWRHIRNAFNTLKDAFNAAIGAVIGQYQKLNPVFSTGSTQVTQIGQTLLSKFANAYEPLLEQYIGQPVILDVADPINPNNATNEFVGYLADYTQNFIAVFNVEHSTTEWIEVTLPDQDSGDVLPPLPPPPAPGAMPLVLPPPLKSENGLAVRLDGLRVKVQNTRPDTIVVRELLKEGFEPLAFGSVLPPNAIFELPARDARAGKLRCEIIRTLDVVAPRKFATIRHAGELLERKGILDDLALPQLPLVPLIPKFLSHRSSDSSPARPSNRSPGT